MDERGRNLYVRNVYCSDMGIWKGEPRVASRPIELRVGTVAQLEAVEEKKTIKDITSWLGEK